MNWKAFLIGAMIFVAWYGGHRSRPPALPMPEKADLSRQYAYNICQQVCFSEQSKLLEAMIAANVLDKASFDIGDLTVIMDNNCSLECKNRIQP